MDAGDGMDSELESFREQWLSDLRRSRPQDGAQAHVSAPERTAAAPAALRQPGGTSRHAPSKKLARLDDDDDYVQARSFDYPAGTPSSGESGVALTGNARGGELVSALDHYEEAVEKEAVGSLGDSLKLYRQAFRMDGRVDQLYRKKHFPLLAQKASKGASQPAPVPAQAPAPPLDSQPQSVKELIAGFSGLSIDAAPPTIEGTPAPPCPIAELPDEIVAQVLREVAIDNVADFVRLSLACKKFAYLVATEEQIWRRVCLGSESGFAGMHHHWQCGTAWEALEDYVEVDVVDGDSGDVVAEFMSPQELSRRREAEKLATTHALLPLAYGSSWQRMFRHRPRIRFHGCYISTVNYIRAGQASPNATTWNSPVHIVTYFRYLRFFRDGAAISLLTTDEPADVVHHLTREAVRIHQGGDQVHLPSTVMQLALTGRWRLSSGSGQDGAESAAATGSTTGDAEGDLYIETEGVRPSGRGKSRHMYRMELSLRSAGKAARNNKLVWRGFYSYNRTTDDWGEFGLKNDKPFFFSRVKSYGKGE